MTSRLLENLDELKAAWAALPGWEMAQPVWNRTLSVYQFRIRHADTVTTLADQHQTLEAGYRWAIRKAEALNKRIELERLGAVYG